MKISREEFKELVVEYQEYWNKYTEVSRYINEDFLDSMSTGYELIGKMDWIRSKFSRYYRFRRWGSLL